MSHETKPLTDEQRRILRAAGEGRLVSTSTGRWIIKGEPERPERRERERLRSRGMIDYPRDGNGRTDPLRLAITDKGYAALGAQR